MDLKIYSLERNPRLWLNSWQSLETFCVTYISPLKILYCTGMCICIYDNLECQPLEEPREVWGASCSRWRGSGGPGWWSCTRPAPSARQSDCTPCDNRPIRLPKCTNNKARFFPAIIQASLVERIVFLLKSRQEIWISCMHTGQSDRSLQTHNHKEELLKSASPCSVKIVLMKWHQSLKKYAMISTDKSRQKRAWDWILLLTW